MDKQTGEEFILPDSVLKKEDSFSIGQLSRAWGTTESPIESDFLWHVSKFLKGNAPIETQYPVSTPNGRFRLDFLVAYRGCRIAFECDGKEFHKGLRDPVRDALLLSNNKVDVIYRFPGHDIAFNIYDVIYSITKFDPNIFSDRGQRNIEKLCSLGLLEHKFNSDREYHYYWYSASDVEGDDHPKRMAYPFSFVRRTKRNLSITRGFGTGITEILRDRPDMPIDEMVERLYASIGMANNK